MSSKTIRFVTKSNTLKYCYKVVFLFPSCLSGYPCTALIKTRGANMYQVSVLLQFNSGWVGQPEYIWSFRAGSTFSVPVCTVPSSMDRTSRYNKVDAVILYASYRLNLLLLKRQRCLTWDYLAVFWQSME